MATWGMNRRPEEKIRDVIDNLFCTRFWDKGKCSSCSKETTGIFGPEGHDEFFYCRKCWVQYLKSADESAWKEWSQWEPEMRQVLSETRKEHELKCVLLALRRVGGSITFPPNLSAYDRLKVHSFCQNEPELSSSLITKSFGEGDKRMLRVSSRGEASAIEEARAVLASDQLDSMPLDELQALHHTIQCALDKRGANAQGVEEKEQHGKVHNKEDQVKLITDKIGQVSLKEGRTSQVKEEPIQTGSDEQKASAEKSQEKAVSSESKEVSPRPPPKPPTRTKPPAVHGETELKAEAKKQDTIAECGTSVMNQTAAVNDTIPVCGNSDFPALSGEFPSLSAGAGSNKKGGRKKK